ncbi:MAG TPA: hypothetical protein VL576_02455 [Candidatus Paceibacterota bacterium]|jgi:hypothetical protein|nr:hypothetical protein [Candidatus Paceibacterota bacterium]
MKNKTFPMLLILIIIALATYIVVGQKHLFNLLPQSFTVKLGATDSSASGSSSYTWVLSFNGNTLTNAVEHYSVGRVGFTGSGDCNFQNGTWVEQGTEDACKDDGTSLFGIPLNRTNLEQKIRNGVFVKGNPDNCGADVAGASPCYQIN